MRLTCPNCGARYEVADSMIPPEGRDVQCSNCSTTWFQPGRRSDQQPRVSVDRSARSPEDEPPPPPSPPDPAAPEPEPETEAPPTVSEAEAVAEAPMVESVGVAADAPEEPRRRDMDPELRDILREEAEREARLRRAEADPVETQAEMPLSEEPEDVHRARRRAELEGAQDAFDEDAGADADRPARELFPDIDEINSTLRDTGDRTSTDADASDIDTLETAPRHRRGVRLGFLIALALAAGAVALHVNADLVATQVPALAPLVEGYSERVNDLRFWLDGMAQRLGETVEGD